MDNIRKRKSEWCKANCYPGAFCPDGFCKEVNDLFKEEESETDNMTLDEAIEHCKEISETTSTSDCKCSEDHIQLANGLSELRHIKGGYTMNYEEKRELRLQISQLLADAGLNQKVIRDMVEKEIENKVRSSVDKALAHLNATCSSGDYVSEAVIHRIQNDYVTRTRILEAVKEEISGRIIQVTFDSRSKIEIENTSSK
jgi:hypothetical protein